jgi:hypothetical protein
VDDLTGCIAHQYRTVDAVDLATYFGKEVSVETGGFATQVIDTFSKSDYGVPVTREVEGNIPAQVLYLDRSQVKCHLNTRVLHVTGVKEVAAEAGRPRKAGLEELINGVLLVVSQVKTNPIAEKPQVYTNFKGFRDRWLKVASGEGTTRNTP